MGYFGVSKDINDNILRELRRGSEMTHCATYELLLKSLFDASKKILELTMDRDFSLPNALVVPLSYTGGYLLVLNNIMLEHYMFPII